LLTKVFRLGPALLLPIVYLWAKIACCDPIWPGEAGDWWRGHPFAVVVVVALLWHLALIAVGKDKLLYSVYALAHVPIFLLVSFFSVMHVTRAAWL
jgi:hypothetical protein